MDTIDKFIEIFNNNRGADTYIIKDPSKYLKKQLININPKCLSLVVNDLTKKELAFCNRNHGAIYYNDNIISFKVNTKTNLVTMFHELGHAIDLISHSKNIKRTRLHYVIKRYSNTEILSNGKTLHQTLKDEIKNNYDKNVIKFEKSVREEAFKSISLEDVNKFYSLKNEIEECVHLSLRFPLLSFNRNDKAMLDRVNNKLDPIVKYNWEKHFKSKDEALKAFRRWNELKNKLGDYSEYHSLYKQITNTNEFKTFAYNNQIISDMFSGYTVQFNYLRGHSISYFKTDGAYGSEFFASCFSFVANNNDVGIEVTKQYFPESIMMFNELLTMIMKNNNIEF